MIKLSFLFFVANKHADINLNTYVSDLNCVTVKNSEKKLSIPTSRGRGTKWTSEIPWISPLPVVDDIFREAYEIVALQSSPYTPKIRFRCS